MHRERFEPETSTMIRHFLTALLVCLLPLTAASQSLTEDEIKELALEAIIENPDIILEALAILCLLYTSPSPRDKRQSRMPSSA